MFHTPLRRALLLSLLLPACASEALLDDDESLGQLEQRQIFDPDDPTGTPQLPKQPKGPITSPPKNVTAWLIDGAMHVSFKCATNTSWHELERSVAGGAYQPAPGAYLPEVSECLLVDPSPQTEAKNCYRVVAHNTDHSAKSENTYCVNTPPAPPVLEGAVTGASTITVTVHESSAIDLGVVLERRAGSVGAFQLVKTWTTSSSVDRVHADTDVGFVGDYTYRARIQSAVGSSLWGAVLVDRPSTVPISPPGCSCPAGGCPPDSPCGSGGSGGSGGGTSSGTGSGKSGVDCGCSKTGDYVPPTPPKVIAGNKSADMKYQGTLASQYLSIKRLSDNKKVFGSPVLNETVWGFGPNSRYLVIAQHQNADQTGGVTLTVNDLETDKKLYSNSFQSSAGWGFSPDGRGFLVTFESPNGQSGYNLLNLDQNKLEKIFLQPPLPGANLFSPCGDLFVFVKTTGSVTANTQDLQFYTLEDLKPKTKIGFKSWNGFVATSTQHEAKRVNDSNKKLFANEAALSCN